ncbi:hypothetical protein WMY93_001591 [Mugilogobius chulae]|uniref:Uncharacterized protein n=1 Tax=Mugilogobius chulae TaxID=88201 RepID=A0AAW0PTH9_9GOBI
MDWISEAPAPDCHLVLYAPDPYTTQGRPMFGLSLARPCGHQVLACVDPPQVWLQGGAAETPGKTQDMLDGLCLSIDLGTPQDCVDRKVWASLPRLLPPRPDSGLKHMVW